MNIAINKFIIFLEKETIRSEAGMLDILTNRFALSEAEIEKKINTVAECKNIARQLRVPEKDYSLHGEVFVDFGILSGYLEKSGLTNKEAMTIIFTFLKKNLAAGIADENTHSFDPHKIDEYPFKSLTSEEVHQLIHEDKYRLLQSKPASERTEKENAIIKELEEFTEQNPSDVEIYRQIHKLIKERYFDNLTDFTQEDVKIFVEQLKKMGLSERYCEFLIEYLNIKAIKTSQKKNRQQQDNNPSSPVKLETTKKPTLSKKETNILYKELSTFYNPDTKTITRYLTIKEIIYCLRLMRKLNFNDSSIDIFLKCVEKSNRQYKIHPITQYIELYNKLKYYEERLNLQDSLSYIESIMQEMCILNEEDYGEWKKLLEEELSNIVRVITPEHEYELKKSLSI